MRWCEVEFEFHGDETERRESKREGRGERERKGEKKSEQK